MIGLGSNRLSVCRRGGMSVTQAGRGGMEWLAGGRRPSWASPYSAQATAALKDAFTAAQWPTIRDYGFAHPEIVPYVNDEPDVIMSIMTLDTIRCLKNSNTAYIQLDYVVGLEDEIEVEFLTDASNTPASICGAGGSTWLDGLCIVTKSGGGKYYAAFGSQSMTDAEYLTASGLLRAVINKSSLTYWQNGEQIFTKAITPTTFTPYKFTTFGNARGSNTNIATHYNGSIKRIYIKRNGEYIYQLIPKTVNGESGWLNMVDGSMLYKTGGSGSFTISETPAS